MHFIIYSLRKNLEEFVKPRERKADMLQSG